MRVCVVGAGEAGRAAAREAYLDGASVTVLDAASSLQPDWRSWPDLVREGGPRQGSSVASRPGLEGDLCLGTAVVSVSKDHALVDGGRKIRGDAFVIATGTQFEDVHLEGRRKPGVSVLDRPGCYSDLGRDSASASAPVVAGEGWRGMEVAERLARPGTAVRLSISSWEGPGPGSLSLEVMVAAAAEVGVAVSRGHVSRALGTTGVEAVLCEGRVLPADALGVAPRRKPHPVQNPASSGAGRAIAVGPEMRSDVPEIIAAGACAAVGGGPGLMQEQGASGRVAGASSAGVRALLSATRVSRSAVFGVRWTRVVTRWWSGPARPGNRGSVQERWGERDSCSIDFDRRNGAVLAIELVEDLRRPELLVTGLPERATLRSLAYDGPSSSSDISLVSETARLGLRHW